MGKLLFIVDDEPMIGGLISEVLQRAGHRTRLFQSPVAALAAFRDADPKPYILITDYQMDELNGLKLIAATTEIHPPLKTVLISGSVENVSLLTAAVSPTRYLPKPFEPRELITLIAELIR